MSETLTPGDPAPDFEAEVVGGLYEEPCRVKLSDFRGRKVVLYFYPKDDTPGCTKQACSIRDKWAHWKELGAAVFGVSIDGISDHRKFIEKYDLPFPLIADPDKEIVQKYGVWVEKSMYGKKYKGTERTTFVVDEQGRVKSVFRKVKPGEHCDKVLHEFASIEP